MATERVARRGATSTCLRFRVQRFGLRDSGFGFQVPDFDSSSHPFECAHRGASLIRYCPPPVRPPQIPRHGAAVGSYGGVVLKPSRPAAGLRPPACFFGFSVLGFGVRAPGCGIRALGFGIRVPGFGLRDSSSGFRNSSSWFRGSGSGFLVFNERYREAAAWGPRDKTHRVPGSGFQVPGSRI